MQKRNRKPQPPTFKPARIVRQTTHFSIKFAVRCGGTSLCYCDQEMRAGLIAKAFNHWRKTDEGKREWDALKNAK